MDKTLLRQLILTKVPTATLTEGGVYIKMRCFMCGDSKNNPYKKRLYIKINPDNKTEPVFYNCFNCLKSGIVNSTFLKQLGITNTKIHVDLTKFNLNVATNNTNNNKTYESIFDVKIPKATKNINTLNKIKYIYDRIGYRIPIDDFEKLKLVFSIKDFLNVNNLEPSNKNLVEKLEASYVGVLTKSNKVIVFRNIVDGSSDFRYIKYNLFKGNSKDNTNNFYTIKNKINIFSPDRIDIILAEGWFDIFSILYNLYNADMTNKIFIALCNGSFHNPIFYYINKGLVGSNIHVLCYQDNDTNVNFREIKKEILPYIENFKVYCNGKSKDFGVPKSEIKVDELI